MRECARVQYSYLLALEMGFTTDGAPVQPDEYEVVRILSDHLLPCCSGINLKSSIVHNAYGPKQNHGGSGPNVNDNVGSDSSDSRYVDNNNCNEVSSSGIINNTGGGASSSSGDGSDPGDGNKKWNNETMPDDDEHDENMEEEEEEECDQSELGVNVNQVPNEYNAVEYEYAADDIGAVDLSVQTYRWPGYVGEPLILSNTQWTAPFKPIQQSDVKAFFDAYDFIKGMDGNGYTKPEIAEPDSSIATNIDNNNVGKTKDKRTPNIPIKKTRTAADTGCSAPEAALPSGTKSELMSLLALKPKSPEQSCPSDIPLYIIPKKMAESAVRVDMSEYKRQHHKRQRVSLRRKFLKPAVGKSLETKAERLARICIRDRVVDLSQYDRAQGPSGLCPGSKDGLRPCDSSDEERSFSPPILYRTILRSREPRVQSQAPLVYKDPPESPEDHSRRDYDSSDDE